jgi:hypothetical protein
MNNAVTVHAPATIANLVCGFDILGLALAAPYDIMQVGIKDEPGITLSSSAAYDLPTVPEDNVAGASLLALMEAYGKPIGFDVYIDKQQCRKQCRCRGCSQSFVGQYLYQRRPGTLCHAWRKSSKRCKACR